MKRSNAPVLFIARRVKKFLLYGALFLVLLNPPVVRGQDAYDFTLQAAMDGYLAYDHWWLYWVPNYDDRTPVQSFGILGLPVPSSHIWVPEESNWFSFVNDERDGTSSIWWLAGPGSEFYAGQVKYVWVWVWGASNTGRGGFCAAGQTLAICAGLNVAAW